MLHYYLLCERNGKKKKKHWEDMSNIDHWIFPDQLSSDISFFKYYFLLKFLTV